MNILITGTSSGIGLATAVELARRGHRVFASMRNLERSGELEAAAAAAAVRVDLVQLDVTDTPSVEDAVASVLSQAGAIDVLVNNAAITVVKPLELMTDREFEGIFETNVVGPFRTARAVLPSMRARGSGRIVNVSSGAAHPRVGVRLWGAYAASKAALHALSLEWVKELAPLGIDVVLVEGGVGAPTPAWTPAVETVASFEPGTSPYGLSETIARAQVKLGSGMGSVEAVAQMLAEACTVAHPPIRFPPEAQASIDDADGIGDDHFLRLARGDTDPVVYEGVAGFWRLQLSLLSPT